MDIAEVDPSLALTLAVGWKSGHKTKLRQISIGGEVEAAFREVVAAAVQNLRDRDGEQWTPDADLTPETYLVISTSDLGEAPVLSADHAGQTLSEALLSAEDLPPLHPDDLPASDLSFYVIAAGNTAGERVALLRRSNPRRGLRRGRIYTLLSDSLQRVEAPIFAFDEFVDLIFVGGNVCILSQSVFSAIFRDQDALTAQVPGWADELHEHISITTEGRDRLISRALKDSRLRARLEAIVKRGHLSDVSTETMRSAMDDAGLDPDRLLNSGGELMLEDADIPEVLYFLNEDLFVGALTSTGFRADKKAAR